MWDTDELYDYALQELRKAEKDGDGKVTIVLDYQFKGDKTDFHSFCSKLKLKAITEKLRKEFSGYTVKSMVDTAFNMFISYEGYDEGRPCDNLKRVDWTLQLQKK